MKSAARAVIRNEYVPLGAGPTGENAFIPRYFLGPNHLLILETQHGECVARRFYFDDITALQCKKTKKTLLIALAACGIMLSFWVSVLLGSFPGTSSFFSLLCIMIFVGSFATMYIVRGVSCRTFLHTRNHTEELTRLNWYRPARRAIIQLNERILARREKSTDTVNLDLPFHFKPPAEKSNDSPVVPYSPYRFRVMMASFVTTLAFVVLELAEALFGIALPAIVGLPAYGLVAVLATLAIIQSHGTTCPPRARRMAGVILANAVLMLPLLALTSIVAGMSSNFVNTSAPPGSIDAEPLLWGYTMVYSFIYMGAAIVGLYALLEARKDAGRRKESQ